MQTHPIHSISSSARKGRERLAIQCAFAVRSCNLYPCMMDKIPKNYLHVTVSIYASIHPSIHPSIITPKQSCTYSVTSPSPLPSPPQLRTLGSVL
ncbi:hypothetical protein EYC84_005698 [Monilinia fructicola]|uniref:Uncharacterized protein n=1 Tax=Monilinia fructicola TaxID=38448 RepID=A0A5M9JX95_MONFR|nr:hypothetical protein EYC84_005698 [Monilinia fructicola]